MSDNTLLYVAAGIGALMLIQKPAAAPAPAAVAGGAYAGGTPIGGGSPLAGGVAPRTGTAPSPINNVIDQGVKAAGDFLEDVADDLWAGFNGWLASW